MKRIAATRTTYYDRACREFDHTNATDLVFARHMVRLALCDCWGDNRFDDEGTRVLARVIAHLNYKKQTGR